MELILKGFDISQNEYFDPLYFQVYICLIILYGLAVILYQIYVLGPDSPTTRAFVPWALLLAAIVNVLIIFWVVIYINFLYDKDSVYVIKANHH